MPTVGVGRRAAAIFLDSLLFLVPAVPIVVHFFSTNAGGAVWIGTPPASAVDQPQSAWVNSAIAILAIAWLAYMTLTESAYGASLGKFALGIRVVRLDGKPVDGFTSFLRNILRVVDGIAFYLVGAILVWNSPLHQRLGDRAAGTIVLPASFAATYRGGAELPPAPEISGPPIPARPDR